MRSLAVGSSSARTAVPTALDTTAALGNPGVDLVSTPSLVAHFEHAEKLYFGNDRLEMLALHLSEAGEGHCG